VACDLLFASFCKVSYAFAKLVSFRVFLVGFLALLTFVSVAVFLTVFTRFCVAVCGTHFDTLTMV